MATLRKWMKINAGKALGVTSIMGLFAFLISLYGFNITGTSDICLGTMDDPCMSEIEVCNPTPYNVDVYNQNEVELTFSPGVKEYYLFRKDGRCRGGTGCAAPSGLSLRGWNFINFSERTKPVSNKAYVYRFPARECKTFLLWGLKNNPEDTITLDFGSPKNIVTLAPLWIPYLNEYYTGQNKQCLRTNDMVCCWLNQDGGSNLEDRDEAWRTVIRSGESGVCVDANTNEVLQYRSDFGEVDVS
jgi:hypothetical protein